MKPNKYTEKEKQFIKDNVKGNTYASLTKLFNEKFRTIMTIGKMKGFWANNKLENGTKGQYKKGHIPLNKGTKGLTGRNKTSFSKGNRPHNYKPIGTERLTKDGYYDVKIKDPNKWRLKHILVWEKGNGPLPKSSAIIFADQNKENLELSNLILISRAELLIMNRKGLVFKDAEMTTTGINLAKLYNTIAKKQNKGK